MRNLSNMFVCELVVLDSVNFYQHIFGRSAIFTQNPLEEYCTRVVSSVCQSISALNEHCTKVVSYVQFVLVSWCCNNPGSQFLADFWGQNHWLQVKLIITYFFMLFICSKTLNNCCSVLCSCQGLRSYVGLVNLGFIPRKVYSTTLLFSNDANITWLYPSFHLGSTHPAYAKSLTPAEPG